MTSVRAEMIALGLIKPAGTSSAPIQLVACPHCRRVLAGDERYAKHLREAHAK